jgi:hypothetical protein
LQVNQRRTESACCHTDGDPLQCPRDEQLPDPMGGQEQSTDHRIPEEANANYAAAPQVV